MPRVIYVEDSSAVPPASPHTANEGCVKLTDKAYQDKSHRREYIWAVKKHNWFLYVYQAVKTIQSESHMWKYHYATVN